MLLKKMQVKVIKNARIEGYQFKDNHQPVNPILFIHGFGAHANAHLRFKEKIVAHDYYAFELNGHNNKLVHPDEVSIAYYVSAINNFIETHKLQRITLIGHSMGGLIAVIVANLIETKLKNLVLVNPLTIQVYKNLLLKPWNFFCFCQRDQQCYQKTETKYHCDTPPIDDPNTRQLYKKNLDQLLKEIINPYNLYRLKNNIKKIKKPTLLISGGNDRYIRSAANIKYLHSLLINLQVHQIANAGHIPFIKNFDEYWATINLFID